MLYSTNLKSNYQMYFIACFQVLHAPKYALKYTPDCTPLYTPHLLNLHCQVSSHNIPRYISKYILNYTPEHALIVTPNYTRWHTCCVLDYMVLSTPPSTITCTLSSIFSRMHTIALNGTLSTYLTVHCQLALKMLSSTLLNTLSTTLPISLNDTLSAYLTLHSQVHSQEARYSQSHLTICSHTCSYMLDPKTYWVGGARHVKMWDRWLVEGGADVTWRAVGSRWQMASGKQCMMAKIIMSVKIMVWTLSLVLPPWQDIAMPYGHDVDNCSLKFCRKSG